MNRWQGYVEKNDLYSHAMIGSRSKLSTQDAMLQIKTGHRQRGKGLDGTGKHFIPSILQWAGVCYDPRPDVAGGRIFFATQIGAGPFTESVLFECIEDLLDGPLLLCLVSRFDGFL